MSAVAHDAPGHGPGTHVGPAERPHPPFTQIGIASLALIIIGGIYLSANIPEQVSLGPAVALLVASALLLSYNVFSLTRVEGFAWWRFAQVAKWTLLAYVTIAGMIEFAFLENHVSGGTLVVLTLSLVVFAIEVPTLIAFTVARYAPSTPDADA
ncbi:MAG: hypothetical protein ABI355_06500 [Solirubrobacteraceae bacterium]